MSKITKKEALLYLNQYKDETNYFNGTLTTREMYEMFRYNFCFGEAESVVIVAALINSGAKFKGRFSDESEA